MAWKEVGGVLGVHWVSSVPKKWEIEGSSEETSGSSLAGLPGGNVIFGAAGGKVRSTLGVRRRRARRLRSDGVFVKVGSRMLGEAVMVLDEPSRIMLNNLGRLRDDEVEDGED